MHLELARKNIIDCPSVQLSCSVVSDSATLWTAACQAFLSITTSQSLLKLMCISDALQPSHPLLSPSPPAFSLPQQQGLSLMSQFFASGGQSLWAILTPFDFLVTFPCFVQNRLGKSIGDQLLVYLSLALTSLVLGRLLPRKSCLMKAEKRWLCRRYAFREFMDTSEEASRKWVLGSTDYTRNSWIFIRRRSKSITSISQLSLFLWRLS